MSPFRVALAIGGPYELSEALDQRRSEKHRCDACASRGKLVTWGGISYLRASTPNRQGLRPTDDSDETIQPPTLLPQLQASSWSGIWLFLLVPLTVLLANRERLCKSKSQSGMSAQRYRQERRVFTVAESSQASRRRPEPG